MKRIQLENRVPLEPNLPLSTPWVLFIDPAASCNFKCRFCFHYNAKEPVPTGVMTWKTYLKIMGDLKEFDKPLKTLRLYAFGEPLLNHNLSMMIKYAKDKQICDSIDTTTNGSLFNPSLNKQLIEAGIDRINISVIGVNTQQYKTFSNYTINFEKYVENIAHLYQHRKKCIIFIKINGDVISKEDQDKFLEIFTPISDGVAIEHTMNCWHDCNMKDVKVNPTVGVYGQELTYVNICPYVFYSFCIHVDGKASACFLDWNKKLFIGDITQNHLIDIWNSNRMNNLRKLMLRMLRSSHPICKLCHQLIAGQPVNLDASSEDLFKRYKFNE